MIHWPNRFLDFINKNEAWILRCLVIATLVSLVFSIFEILDAPEDYLQGIYAKIMYIHIPCAWLSLGIYTAVGLCSAAYLIAKNPAYFLFAKALAGIGVYYTLITLITGSIWGKPTWGAWWVWDARLTSMLILFFIYAGFLTLLDALEDEERAAYICSIYALVGLVNIPIIKFSVNLWNTLHQPASIFRSGGAAIHESMLTPLIATMLTLLLFTCFIFILRIQISIVNKKRNSRR